MKALGTLQAYLRRIGPEQKPTDEYVKIDITELGKIFNKFWKLN